MFIKLRLLFIIVIVLGSAIPCLAQNSINGRVIDEKGDPLPYATVVLMSPSDSTVQYYDIVDDEGKYKIYNIKNGKYLIQFSFVGKIAIYEEVTIPLESGEDFGDKMMKEDTITTGEVIVLADRVPIQVVKDTVTYDAKAFKTKPGAVVEDLLKKLPGIEVDKAGNVKALGEDVTKVLVDGKVFFGNDPKVATKNLPADAIDKVQVYDKRSDEADFMGIDDGVRDRTINLLLNEDSKKGYFGNAGAGIATEDHYKSKGDLYRFSSTIQTAILGMSNDVNQFGFTGQGDQFGQETPGLNSTTAGGLNLSYNTTNSNRNFISYLGSSTKRSLIQNTSTENFLQDGSYFQDADLVSENRNKPHNINFGVHHNFKKQRFQFDGNVNVGNNTGTSHTLTNTNQDDGSPVNMLDNSSNNQSDNFSANAKAVYINRLYGSDTQFKIGVNSSYNKNSSELDWVNIITFYDPNIVTTNDHYQDNKTENLSFSINPTFVQRISPFWNLNTGVNIGANDRNLDRKQGNSGLPDAVIDSLSADFNTNELYANPFLNLQRLTEKTYTNFSIAAKWIQFDKVFYNSSLGKTNYLYFTPGFSYNNNYREGRRVEIRYSARVGLPGLNQLLPVNNTVNAFSQYQGNINLKPEYMHTGFITWSIFDAFSFTSVFTRLNFGYTKDKISMSQTITDDFVYFNTPVNVPYRFNAGSQVDFSTPIRSLGIIFSAKSNESYSKGSNIINAQENIQTTLSHTLNLSLGNRNKQVWDLTTGAAVTLNDTKFSISEYMDNTFFNTTYFADFYITPTDQWSIDASANIVNYNSQSFDESVSIPLINASIGYYFLEGNKAGLTLQVHDLLNKYSGFERIAGANYLMERERNNIGRYVMLTFNLRRGGRAGKGGGKR